MSGKGQSPDSSVAPGPLLPEPVLPEPLLPEPLLVDVARALAGVLDEVRLLAGGQQDGGQSLSQRLEEHLGADPRSLPVVSHELPPYQLVDVQVALEAWPAAAEGRSVDVIGVAGDQRRFHPLSELLRNGRHIGVVVGPVEYIDLADSPTSTRNCVRFGVFLLLDGAKRAAALLRAADPHGPMHNAMIEVVAADAEHARQLLQELRHLAVEHSVLRGQVMSLGLGEGHQYGSMRFMARPVMGREELVLPDLALAQVERHVIGVAEHGARLVAAGQHVKRGVLLYGPPGTGKTHTVRYLLSRLTGVTAFVLSGQALGLVGQACALARVLQPSIVVLEDVDLIAGDRSFAAIGSNPVLFEVLNQIDGLGDDVDVTFLLTTNRVDILERALSQRPGRVDAAIEIAVPDDEGRARLLRLYGREVGVGELSDEQLGDTVAATSGCTATYLREVVRRAALAVAEATSSGPLRVDERALAVAAAELLEGTEALTRSLLGGARGSTGEGDTNASGVNSTGVNRTGVNSTGVNSTGVNSTVAGPPFTSMARTAMASARGSFSYGPGRGQQGPAAPFAPEPEG